MPPTEPQVISPLPPAPKGRGFLVAGCIAALAVVAVGMFLFMNRNQSEPVAQTYSDSAMVGSAATSGAPTQYVAFQIFVSSGSKTQLESLPASGKPVEDTVNGIINAVGAVGNANRRLGFIPGPISFDQTDDQVRQLMRDSFAVALKKNIAVGFHLDDSMFWARLSNLNTPENIEWLDWNKTPNTGRRLDWSATPTKIAPQLCLNGVAVKAEVAKRAALIGEEVARGLKSLKAAKKEGLFIGVIAGWETQMGRDFDTGKYLGYCALTNNGFSAKKPPKDIDQARVSIVKDFIDFWTSSLAAAGVPDAKIYSHTAFAGKQNYDAQHPAISYIQAVNFTPTSAALGPHHYPGYSTYPEAGHTEEILAERSKNGNPPWISAEGAAIDPAQAETGTGNVSMEGYLAGLFNRGAVVVNVFGWGVGPTNNPFRKAAEGASAIEAYKKFLRGEALSEPRATPPGSKSDSLQNKAKLIQANGPAWVHAHPDQQQAIAPLFQQLDGYIKAGDLVNANKTADAILRMIGVQ